MLEATPATGCVTNTKQRKNMKKILAFALIAIGLNAFGSSEVEGVKQSLKALVKPILQKTGSDNNPAKDFSVEKCEKYKINWMDVILMRKSATMTYTFQPGCDIEGTVTPKVFVPFNTDFKLKNLQDFTHLLSENKITASLESEPLMNLEIRKAKLSGTKGVIKFEADYSVKIDPLNKTKPIKENKGGEIRITEIYGKAVSIKEKITIK
jgi:hypothetical protein